MKFISLKKALKIIMLIVASFISIIASSIPISKIEDSSENAAIVNSNVYAITHVNIIPFEERDSTVSSQILYDQTIIIEEGKIISISKSTNQIPNNIEVIDAQGKYIMPGLVDMHTHLFDKSDLRLYLANGVTTVRNMMGFSMHLKWKQQIKEGKFAGATLYTGSPTLNKGDNAGPFHKKIKKAEKVEKVVRKYAESGYDFIKIYDGLDNETLDAIISEAKKHNMPVAGHLPYDIEFDELIQKDILSFEHVEELLQAVMHNKYSEKEMRVIAQKIKANNIYITPTLSAYYNILQATVQKEAFLKRDSTVFINPVLRFIGRKQLKEYVEKEDNSNVILKYKILQYILKVLNEEGVMLLLGTDCGPNLTLPGFSLIEEIELGVKSGVSRYDMLLSGTLNAAKALGIEEQSGSVSVGKTADLILLNQNPLESTTTLKNPHAVIKNGVMYDEKALLEMIEKGKKHASVFRTIGRFLNQMISK